MSRRTTVVDTESPISRITHQTLKKMTLEVQMALLTRRVELTEILETALTSTGVPERPLGIPPVVVFNLGRGGVPWGRPVVG